MVRVKKTVSRKKSWGIGYDGSVSVRYDAIPRIIREIGAKVILEVGVYRCVRAEKMIQAALETPGKVTYYGFDLFEDFTEEVSEYEAAPKPLGILEAKRRLEGFGVDVNLIIGDTRHTLPKFVSGPPYYRPDFVYIDGGHSELTVASDWGNIQQIMHNDTVVVFDDYLEHSDWLKWGCNKVIDNLAPEYKYKLLEPHDRYSLKQCGSFERKESKSWLAKVVRKN
jgi:predicted O-methyltransferase YrrM